MTRIAHRCGTHAMKGHDGCANPGIVDPVARRYGARAWATDGARTRERIDSTVSTRRPTIETTTGYWRGAARLSAGGSTGRRAGGPPPGWGWAPPPPVCAPSPTAHRDR